MTAANGVAHLSVPESIVSIICVFCGASVFCVESAVTYLLLLLPCSINLFSFTAKANRFNRWLRKVVPALHTNSSHTKSLSSDARGRRGYGVTSAFPQTVLQGCSHLDIWWHHCGERRTTDDDLFISHCSSCSSTSWILANEFCPINSLQLYSGRKITASFVDSWPPLWSSG
jgi:hypothetical protein